MTGQQDDNPAALDPVRKETGLVPRSGFLACCVRSLTQQARENALAEDPVLPDVDSYLAFERGMNHVALG